MRVENFGIRILMCVRKKNVEIFGVALNSALILMDIETDMLANDWCILDFE